MSNVQKWIGAGILVSIIIFAGYVIFSAEVVAVSDGFQELHQAVIKSFLIILIFGLIAWILAAIFTNDGNWWQAVIGTVAVLMLMWQFNAAEMLIDKFHYELEKKAESVALLYPPSDHPDIYEQTKEVKDYKPSLGNKPMVLSCASKECVPEVSGFYYDGFRRRANEARQKLRFNFEGNCTVNDALSTRQKRMLPAIKSNSEVCYGALLVSTDGISFKPFKENMGILRSAHVHFKSYVLLEENADSGGLTISLHKIK